MAAATKALRISIGFAGGQVIAARVAARELEALRKGLELREGWYELVCEDATMHLDLTQVCFVRIDSDDQRVGFGA